MYNLFGVLYHKDKPIGGAYLLNKKRVMTAESFENKLAGDLKIKFGINPDEKFESNITKFSTFNLHIVEAKVSSSTLIIQIVCHITGCR